MRKFYTVCFKYQCASPKDIGGDTNYSSKGWNGMLGENFGPAMDTSARRAAAKVEDSIWRQNDQEQYKLLSDGMSAVFADVMRANFGFSEDLFCGSGNSVWSDPKNPGKGKFDCTPVRIVVNAVKRRQAQADESTEGLVAINRQRLQKAEALYGPNAGYWLGLQDSIEKCKSAGATCVFNIGGPALNPTTPIQPTVTGPFITPTPIPNR